MASSSGPTLFQQGGGPLPPLAERVRPASLDDFVGHSDLVGPDHLLGRMAATGKLFSLIFWGPPGVGKTTLAKILARTMDAPFYEISAVSSGVKELRKLLDKAAGNREMGQATVLFIDEIHRFNKAQQDGLLHAVEDGTITLFGATTENPSFEVISPLLSRCRVIRLKPYDPEQLEAMLTNALAADILLSQLEISIAPEVRKLLTGSAGGDARKMFNTLEIAIARFGDDRRIAVQSNDVTEALQERNLLYDRAGDYHYDTISAFIKSLRGSDPDAAIYWLAVMLEGGEQPEFIGRRLVIQASEDVGNADPQALFVATTALNAIHMIGMPEAAIILAQATTYIASAPKSNAAYMAIKAARSKVQEDGFQSVPLHLRNAVTGLMKNAGYGKDYVYPHDQPEGFATERYFPDGMTARAFYQPTGHGHEEFIRNRLKRLWPERY